MTSSWTAFSVLNLLPLNKISRTIITKAQISFECHDIMQIKIEPSSEACHLSLFFLPHGDKTKDRDFICCVDNLPTTSEHQYGIKWRQLYILQNFA